jgi:hypothetical protein
VSGPRARGFAPRVTEIQGSLTLADGVLRGDNVQAIFLDGPLTASVAAAGAPGYRTRIDLEGEVTIDAVVDAFNLPYGDLLAGSTSWQGTLLLPAAAGAQSLPPSHQNRPQTAHSATHPPAVSMIASSAPAARASSSARSNWARSVVLWM